jgi:casein kinase 1
MTYVRRLGFEENPDYTYLRSLFENFMKELEYEDDGQFDWVI